MLTPVVYVGETGEFLRCKVAWFVILRRWSDAQSREGLFSIPGDELLYLWNPPLEDQVPVAWLAFGDLPGNWI